MEKTKTYLTYEQCQLLLPAKSKRKHRTLTQCSRLYRHENGQSYVVKTTTWRTSKTTGEKEVYDPPIAVIHPHNVAVLDDTANTPGVITVHNLYYKFFGIRSRRRSDKRSSVRFWWFNARNGWHANVDWKPFTKGMQLDILTGDAVAGVEEEKRRRVDPEKAKPIRDQIAAWDKFARTYFQMLDTWGENETTLAKSVRETCVTFPRIDEEPSVEGLLQIIFVGNKWNTWRLVVAYQRHAALEQARSSWGTAFEKWKEHLYAEHGAFTWETAKKAA